MRAQSTNTTTQLREQPFVFVIAPANSTASIASGSLYIDDGVSLTPPQHSITSVSMTYANGTFKLEGTFGFTPAPGVESLNILGVSKAPQKVTLESLNANGDGNGSPHTIDGESVTYNATSQSLLLDLGAFGVKLDRGFEVELSF